MCLQQSNIFIFYYDEKCCAYTFFLQQIGQPDRRLSLICGNFVKCLTNTHLGLLLSGARTSQLHICGFE